MIYVDLKTGEELDFRINAARKIAIKKTFAVAHKLKRETATLQDIKKLYPQLNMSKAISWITVLADCLELMDRNEKTPNEIRRDEVDQAINNYPGVRSYAPDSVVGYRVKIGYEREFIGAVGYSEVKDSWYYSSGLNGFHVACRSAGEALYKLLIVRGVIRKSA